MTGFMDDTTNTNEPPLEVVGDPTPPDVPVGEAASEPDEDQDSLLSPDLSGDSLIEGGEELGGPVPSAVFAIDCGPLCRRMYGGGGRGLR